MLKEKSEMKLQKINHAIQYFTENDCRGYQYLQKMIVEAIRPLPFQSSKFLVVRNGETTTSRLDGTSYPILKNPKLPNPKLWTDHETYKNNWLSQNSCPSILTPTFP